MKYTLLLVLALVAVAFCAAQDIPATGQPETATGQQPPSEVQKMRLHVKVVNDSFFALAAPMEEAADKNDFKLFVFKTKGFPRWQLYNLDRSQIMRGLESAEEVSELPIEDIDLEEFVANIQDAKAYRFGLRRGVELESSEGPSPRQAEETSEEACLKNDTRILNQLSLLDVEWSEIAEQTEEVRGEDGEAAEVRIFRTNAKLPKGNLTLISYFADSPVTYNDMMVGPDRIKFELELGGIESSRNPLAFISLVEARDEITKIEKSDDEEFVRIGEDGEISWPTKIQVDGESVDVKGYIISEELAKREEEKTVEVSEDSLKNLKRSALIFCVKSELSEEAMKDKVYKWSPTLMLMKKAESSE